MRSLVLSPWSTFTFLDSANCLSRSSRQPPAPACLLRTATEDCAVLFALFRTAAHHPAWEAHDLQRRAATFPRPPSFNSFRSRISCGSPASSTPWCTIIVFTCYHQQSATPGFKISPAVRHIHGHSTTMGAARIARQSSPLIAACIAPTVNFSRCLYCPEVVWFFALSHYDTGLCEL